ncbi:homoserine kinase [Ideonella livida]|uniref:Homoserine kinase n=1 Tax=Ideonella livida TaxID=2707176 RepID=A0A7C9PHX3_9BURK|nr:homoserine kinase [Ideonella livida]NDY91652.1 homoserine kinase [Ideonella livida]
MAVYTHVTPAEVQPLLHALGLGTLELLEPIASGIENTNYFVTTGQGRWVLTLFERLQADQLPYYLELMRHLAGQGLPVPMPVAHPQTGALVHALAGKPAGLVSRLSGRSLDRPGPAQLAQLGTTLAGMHRAVEGFPLRQPNLRGLDWQRQAARQVAPYLDTASAALLAQELALQEAFRRDQALGLPVGAVHADLFRDNTLFDGAGEQARLSGVLDFYFAGDELLTYDLAVVINDWCVDLDSGALQPELAQALLQAYQAERPLSPAEQAALPVLRRGAALRFWLSRLADWHLPRPASLLTPKPPQHFERVLRQAALQPPTV